jgi:hypothetical protein
MRHLLLPAQAWWDAQRFDQSVWQVAEWRDQKVRHIQLHVAKALGKVVAALSAGEGVASGTDTIMRVRDEVLPDVAIYRSQLINTFPDWCAPTASPGSSSTPVTPRAAGVQSHGRTQRAETLLHVVLALSRASASLAAYIEPREHGTAIPASLIGRAVQDLHDSAETLAAYFVVDSTQAHQARLEALLGAPLPVALVEGGGPSRLFAEHQSD